MYLEIINENAEQSLTDLLQDWAIPRKVRHFLRIKKHVTVNGESVPFHTVVPKGAVIGLTFDEEDYPSHQVIPNSSIPVEVLFEDEHIIVVNKPCGIKTHPNQPKENDTMLNAVASYTKGHPYVVHRLDKETSGTLLFAKNPVILPLLGRQLEEKTMYREYEALAKGHLTHDFTCCQPIGKDRHDKRKRCITKKGQPAITHIKIIKEEKNATRIQCRLETGRTHQIRVHLSSIGHPLVGDPLYGQPAQRLYLHAAKLTFFHPFLQQKIRIICPTPF